MQQTEQIHLTLYELVRRALRVRQEGAEVLQGMFVVRRVLGVLLGRDLDLQRLQVLRHAGQHPAEGRSNVPKGRELDLDAARDVGFDDVQEGLVPRGFLRGELGAAVLRVAFEEARRFLVFGLVARLLVRKQDDGPVFAVALREEVVCLPVQGFPGFEQPFQLRQLLEEFWLLIPFFLRRVGAGLLCVGEEAAAQFFDGGVGFRDAVGEEGV